MGIQNSFTHTTESSADQLNGYMEYDQGEEGSNIQFTIVCSNVPIGSTVSFNCPEAGPQPPINLPPTQVITFPSFTTGIVTYVPANFTGTISYKVIAGQRLPEDARVTLQAAYPQ
jgi:hypothetical protein